jgi:hypothetical protein
MARREDVGRRRALAKHGLNRISRDEMDEKKDCGNYQPEHRNGIQKPRREKSDHPGRSVLITAQPNAG